MYVRQIKKKSFLELTQSSVSQLYVYTYKHVYMSFRFFIGIYG